MKPGDYSARAAYQRSLDMIDEEEDWYDEDLERDIDKDDQ